MTTLLRRDLGLPLSVRPERARAHPRWPRSRCPLGCDLRPLLPQSAPCARRGHAGMGGPGHQPDLWPWPRVSRSGTGSLTPPLSPSFAVHRPPRRRRRPPGSRGGPPRPRPRRGRRRRRVGRSRAGWPAKTVRDEHERVVSELRSSAFPPSSSGTCRLREADESPRAGTPDWPVPPSTMSSG